LLLERHTAAPVIASYRQVDEATLRAALTTAASSSAWKREVLYALMACVKTMPS
jgi:hypothetical protein